MCIRDRVSTQSTWEKPTEIQSHLTCDLSMFLSFENEQTLYGGCYLYRLLDIVQTSLEDITVFRFLPVLYREDIPVRDNGKEPGGHRGVNPSVPVTEAGKSPLLCPASPGQVPETCIGA
eukprot:TRINITY_DN14013_c0_g1_i1.p4 TRINITY_DN14013_c0_g1~~TRINITY_DN14013_c0_g1_i1.p4  ORF type:complete len:119 (-),score=9.48 TRINITY_DN14013_c0_g1_i1:669-1025(-)